MIPSPTLLISLDFDGTLSLEGEVPGVHPSIHDALEEWTARGALWLINTGRSLPHAMEGLVEAGFRSRPSFLITRERDIHSLNPFNRWVPLGNWNEEAEKAHHKLFRRCRSLFRKIRRFIDEETLASFLELPEEPAGIVSSNLEEMEEICAFVDPLLAEEPDLRYERNSIYLRFSHRAYSKGTALAHLAGRLGLEPARVFAAGDNHNDLTMLDPAVAGHLACPANALPLVRERVRALGGYCSDLPGAAGVAEALRAVGTRGN
jgi:hydroxymethylpyrimidine pyrophosphatase-like HAD family hydrolase